MTVRAPQKFELNFSSDPKIDKLNGLPPVKRVKDKPCPFKIESENDAFDDVLVSLFMAGNFEKLNSELKRVNGMRTLYGSSLICRSIDVLQSRHKGFALAKSWNEGSFHSEFSECVLGSYLTAKAWEARGDDYADTVTEEGWILFAKFKAQASECYKRSIALNPSFSPAIEGMLIIVGSACDNQQLNLWVNLGLKIEPSNISLLTSAFHFLQPRWGGSERLMTSLAEQLKTVDQKVSPTLLSLGKYSICMMGLRKYENLDNTEKVKYNQRLFKSLTTIFKSKLIPVYPNSQGPYITLLGVANALKMKDEFDVIFKEGIKKYPESHNMYALKAMHLLRTAHRPDKRFALAKKVVELRPSHGEAWLRLAQIAQKNKGLATEQEQEVFFKNALKLITLESYIPELMALKATYLLKEGKVDNAIAILKEYTLDQISLYGSLCSQISKFYYKKGKYYNAERAWGFYMLPWYLSQSKTTDIPMAEMLALAVKTDSIDPVKLELYIRARNQPVYIGGSYPIEGSIRAYKLCIENFNAETPISLKRQIPNILAKFIKKTQGPCQDLIRYQKMSVDAEIDAWNGSMLAYYLGYVAGANNKPLPYKEMAKYYTLSAEASLAKKYHFGKYCKNQVNSILVAAKFEYDLSNPKKALELLTELLKSKDYSKAVRGKVTLYSGLASMKLKKYAEAKVHFTETIQLTKNKNFRKQAKKNLAMLKKKGF